MRARARVNGEAAARRAAGARTFCPAHALAPANHPPTHIHTRTRPSPPRAFRQAARDIAGTISSSANRVYLNAENLMLNLGDGTAAAAAAKK